MAVKRKSTQKERAVRTISKSKGSKRGGGGGGSTESKRANRDEQEALKPKKQKARVRRILAKMAPLLVENTKRCLVFKGHRTSQLVQDAMQEIGTLLKPNIKTLSRKNEVLPFEDLASLEFLASKNDCSLFMMGSHTKKRPDNLVLGRMYDGHLLDMIEFGVESFSSISEFEGFKKLTGSKPMIVFLGDLWKSDPTFVKARNLLNDLFRGDRPDRVSLKGLDHVLSFTCQEGGAINVRTYTSRFLKSGEKVPLVDLNEMGPFLTLKVRRTQFASDDLWKLACKKPKALKPTKVKNISRNSMGDKLGKFHLKRQDISNMGGKRMPVLHDRVAKKSDAGGGGGGDKAAAVGKKRKGSRGSNDESSAGGKRTRA